MSDFQKNSVKLLPNIYNSNNNVLFYTAFDGMFEVGDKLYIMVSNNGSDFPNEYYMLDSYYNSGYTQSKNGYTLLSKNGNSIVLDIDYEQLYSNITSLTVDCYISRVYIKNAQINNSTINGVSLYNVNFNVTNTLNLKWKQGVIFNVSGNTIQNVDFKSKYSSDTLIMKSIINTYGDVESFYTYNNYNYGLTIVNVIGPRIILNNCNLESGSYYSCDILSPTNINYIYGGYLNDCNIGDVNNTITTDKITIDGGYLYNCTSTTSIFSSLIWLNGTWYNDWDGTSGVNPFNFLEWNDGTWENGIFPVKVWKNGRFMNGIFNGNYWYGGIFNNGTFNNGEWVNGTFNNGTMNGLNWYNGTINNGILSGCTWYNGTFNGGIFQYGKWIYGTVNYGIFENTIWTGGTFNDGSISGCTWYNGTFINGLFQYSTWYNGTFHNGTFNKSTWSNGKFYNGSIFDSIWNDGQMFFGIITTLEWNGGIWYDGIANIINFNYGIWYNGVFNNGTFINGTWYDGSFNNGIFGVNGSPYIPVWSGGTFYNGQFYGNWVKGTFYIGIIGTNSYVPSKDYIGKEFIPYNKNGLIYKSQTISKQPKNPSIISTTITDAKTMIIKKDKK